MKLESRQSEIWSSAFQSRGIEGGSARRRPQGMTEPDMFKGQQGGQYGWSGVGRGVGKEVGKLTRTDH